MTAWQEFSAADFDAARAPKGAVRKARETQDQAGLFFVATPVARPAKTSTDSKRMPEDVALFGADGE
jgi:hypothetical protein